MKNSSLTLVNYQFTKLSCIWKDGKNTKTNHGNMLIDYDVFRNNANPLLFRLDLKVSIDPEKDDAGMKIDTCIVGFFQFDEGTPEDEMHTLVRINGISILYSTLRGHISVLTSNFPSGCTLLPSIIVKDVVDTIESKRQEKTEKDK